MLRITLVKSPIGYNYKQGDTIKALGLRRMNSQVELPDSPTVRGMIHKVKHLVKVEEVN
jgi:large subunit ribosomal protein L30